MQPILAVILFVATVVIVRRTIRYWRSERRWIENCCPHCGYDLRSGHERCPECGMPVEIDAPRHVRLRDEWPANAVSPRRPAEDEKRLVVHQTGDGIEADLLCQQLNARGIRCVVDRVEGVVSGITGVQSVGRYDLTIWSGDELEAKAAVKHLLGS